MKHKEEHTNKAAGFIGKILEKQFGVKAIHCGNFPKDWVKPGGFEEDNYHTTMKGMQSSSDVIEKGELKRPKHEQENDLFERKMICLRDRSLKKSCQDT